MQYVIPILLTLIGACLIIFTFAALFYKLIYLPYKRAIVVIDLNDLYAALDVIMQNEIQLYERSIFESGGAIVTNATFENYYNDICENIGKALSDNLIQQFSFYMSKKALFKFIARTVKTYLSNKIM